MAEENRGQLSGHVDARGKQTQAESLSLTHTHRHTHTHTPVATLVINYKVSEGWMEEEEEEVVGVEDSENAAVGTVTRLLAFSRPA